MMLSRRLFKLIITCFCVLSFAPAVLAQEAASRASAGSLLEVKVAAPALKGNLLSDPAEQSAAKIRQRVETRVLQFFSNRLEFASPK